MALRCEDVFSAFCSICANAVVSMSGGDKHGGLTCKSHVSQPAAFWHEYFFHSAPSSPQQRHIVNISWAPASRWWETAATHMLPLFVKRKNSFFLYVQRQLQCCRRSQELLVKAACLWVVPWTAYRRQLIVRTKGWSIWQDISDISDVSVFFLPKATRVNSNHIPLCYWRLLGYFGDTQEQMYRFSAVAISASADEAPCRCRVIKGGHRLIAFAAVGNVCQEQSWGEAHTTRRQTFLQGKKPTILSLKHNFQNDHHRKTIRCS